MEISSLRRDGSTLIIKGKIFGTMPLSGKLEPQELRRGFALLNFRMAIFLITLFFRRSLRATATKKSG